MDMPINHWTVSERESMVLDCGALSPQAVLQRLLNSSIVVPEEWQALPLDAKDEVSNCITVNELLTTLVHHGLLTNYQVERIQTNETFGLILGNYRVLERLGAGGMGVVYKAEHLRMRKRVAIKVLSAFPGQSSSIVQRFFAEMRAVAQLEHPNI